MPLAQFDPTVILIKMGALVATILVAAKVIEFMTPVPTDAEEKALEDEIAALERTRRALQ